SANDEVESVGEKPVFPWQSRISVGNESVVNSDTISACKNPVSSLQRGWMKRLKPGFCLMNYDIK
ncbi:MAG TPA: hypothetical protein PK530_13635, partial [Anaerolineales bacterium]|nr:hypothetical protein [Anaerolineales bacterium]